VAAESEHEEDQAVEAPERSTPISAPSSTLDFFEHDDRLTKLERHDREHRRTIVQLQDAVIDQILTLGTLEIVFAIFLAVNVWTHHKQTLREAVAA